MMKRLIDILTRRSRGFKIGRCLAIPIDMAQNYAASNEFDGGSSETLFHHYFVFSPTYGWWFYLGKAAPSRIRTFNKG